MDVLAGNVGILSHIKYGRYRGMMAKTLVSKIFVKDLSIKINISIKF